MTCYRFRSIAEVGELLRQRKVSPGELVAECLEHIEREQPRLNAFITITARNALRQAALAEREIARGGWKGPLHGIPIGVKDFFDTAGIRTTAATAALKDRVPRADADVVARLKTAGAIVLGKLNMHELGRGTTSVVSYFGAVRNPWHTAYVAGGSSGGSAAAVAAGLCFATIDTDAIGSCRLPAACCGVVGFKPTYGLLSTQGILAGQRTDKHLLLLGHTALTCRTVEDAAILLYALAPPEFRPNAPGEAGWLTVGSVHRCRIGVAKNVQVTDEVRAAFTQAVKTFQRLGYPLYEVQAPLEFSALDLEQREIGRAALAHSLFQAIDVLLLPTLTGCIPTIAQAREKGPQAISSEHTFFSNSYGLPAISVPCGFNMSGLPTGLQIVGPQWGEAAVLDVAYAFQQATPWHESHPPQA
ncbi:MAG TPA: amidase [Ktedonobacteraceae bacterium]|jgi:aspartyl-tRNA(Asn)/glutamyl-tRNA(Gln) amidotransferase subunit A